MAKRSLTPPNDGRGSQQSPRSPTDFGPRTNARVHFDRLERLPSRQLEWGSPHGALPNADGSLRLECAHHIWQMVSAAEGDDVARAWFVGGNPWMRDDSPVTAIREGRFEEVANAAKACVDDSFSG